MSWTSHHSWTLTIDTIRHNPTCEGFTEIYKDLSKLRVHRSRKGSTFAKGLATIPSVNAKPVIARPGRWHFAENRAAAENGRHSKEHQRTINSLVSTCFNMFQHVSTCFYMLLLFLLFPQAGQPVSLIGLQNIHGCHLKPEDQILAIALQAWREGRSHGWWWMVMDGDGWWWMVMDGDGWWWMVMDGDGWWWMVMDGDVVFGWHHWELVTFS